MVSEINSPLQPSAPLELDGNHPGLNDAAYIARRRDLYNLAYEYRVAEKGWPRVDYTPEEHALWRNVSQRLVDVHERLACKLYLDGKQALGIETEFMPQLGAPDEYLKQHHTFGLVPAEGLLEGKLFFEYLRGGRMPCTQFLRHPSVPEFTPEPDAIHDVIGHVPCLVDEMYPEVVRLIGGGLLASKPEHRSAWTKLYWFTIEFGLIEEKGKVKVLGAGLLSSFEEMEYCFSDKVERRPYVLDDVITQAYDANRKQDVVFIIPELDQLAEDALVLRNKTAREGLAANEFPDIFP